MKLLLDTQCWLWMQATPERFSQSARELVDDPDNVLLLSPVSAWEIATKHALGRLVLPAAPADYVPSRMKSSGVDALPLQHSHALQVAMLPSHGRGVRPPRLRPWAGGHRTGAAAAVSEAVAWTRRNSPPSGWNASSSACASVA